MVTCPNSLPVLLNTVSQLVWGGRGGEAEREKEKPLTLCTHCSVTAQAAACPQLCFGHKSATQHHASCCKENQLCPSQNQYMVCLAGKKNPAQLEGLRKS